MRDEANAQAAAVQELDPKLRLLLIAIRRALMLVADALGAYCNVPSRE